MVNPVAHHRHLPLDSESSVLRELTQEIRPVPQSSLLFSTSHFSGASDGS